ncbi:RNA polymerase sigma factor [Thermanaeromonas sp. C210]|uniref:RNA polymerase sigma factor n=1 Tax=Thermanaeromonas sp. C210 TaxID=2731925 RepID=UPI00155C8C58|nr:RNA polymerase sigma factor [Thermanaeromonas sp. C210]GFN21825.1 RNA polymerase sigma factor [Thermanaeromonas sp. C210]
MGDAESLIARIQEGDTSAFEELVVIYKDKVYSLALTLAGNRADAEDLTQEIFLRIYTSLPDFARGKGSFDAWVHRIGVNLWIDSWRRRKKLQTFSIDGASTSEEEGTGWELPSAEEDVQEKIDKKEFWQAVWKAMGELPENYRLALKLRAIDELSYKEIAATLGESEAAVKSRLNRCRQLLKEKLRRDGFLP